MSTKCTLQLGERFRLLLLPDLLAFGTTKSLRLELRLLVSLIEVIANFDGVVAHSCQEFSHTFHDFELVVRILSTIG